MDLYKAFLKPLLDASRDLLPIVAVIAFFQILVLRQPIPDFANILIGVLFVVVGLALFVRGLEMGLFPIGETMAYAFARKGSVFWLLVFAFALGFGTTVAEPALIAVAGEAAVVAAAGGTEIPCVPYASFGTDELAAYVCDGLREQQVVRNAVLQNDDGLCFHHSPFVEKGTNGK